MDAAQRGVVLYGPSANDVAAALSELDPRYVPAEQGTPATGQVPVLCRATGSEADLVRAASPGIAWLVVEMYGPEPDVAHAGSPVLYLNASKLGPRLAARAVDQPDLVTWYEIINPIRMATVDGGPAKDDYSNLTITVPDDHRLVAHAVRRGEAPPNCLPDTAERVLISDDLWVLAGGRFVEQCNPCTRRHR